MQYNGLSYRPYLDFPSFFHYYLFSGPGSNPGSHFVFSFHASLVSCNLRPFLGLCLLCLVGFIEYWPAICKTPQCFQEANQNWRTSLGLEKLHKEGLCVASDRKPTLNHPVTQGICGFRMAFVSISASWLDSSLNSQIILRHALTT